MARGERHVQSRATFRRGRARDHRDDGDGGRGGDDEDVEYEEVEVVDLYGQMQ